MSEQKLTPWFAGCVKPARPGVYLATILMNSQLDDSRGLYRYWNGKHWGRPADNPAEAVHPTMQRRAYFIMYWRGLAKPPKSAHGVKEGGNA